MNNKIQYIDGDSLNQEQLALIAEIDNKIPMAHDSYLVCNEEVIKKRIDLIKNLKKPNFFKVAILENQIIGFHIIESFQHDLVKAARILTLWVDVKFQNKGIAKDFKQQGVEWAKQHEFPFIETFTHQTNKRMQDINLQNGWKVHGITMRLNLKDEHKDMYVIPEFSTERIILKAPTIDDAKNYQKHFDDYEVIRNLSTAIPWPYPTNGAEEYLKNVVVPLQGKDRWTWGVYLKSKPSELIGCVDLFKRSERGNRGFWLGKSFWNKGIMTEAVKPIVDYAFLQLGFDKLVFYNALGNIGSRRIKEKTGAKFIKVKDMPHVDPKLTQSEQWELTREDWLTHSRPSFISNYKDLMDIDNAHYPNSEEQLAIGSPVGKKLGLQKIGIHIETIPPGRRTSWPHAESEEEEFAYVIKGNPQVWLNGFLCELSEGDFVALPAGTGIAHTFINNSKENVLLLVGGQVTILSNKVFYPMHPKRNQEMKDKGVLWEDSPKQELGPHNGMPDGANNEI